MVQDADAARHLAHLLHVVGEIRRITHDELGAGNLQEKMQYSFRTSAPIIYACL